MDEWLDGQYAEVESAMADSVPSFRGCRLVWAIVDGALDGAVDGAAGDTRQDLAQEVERE